MEVFKMKGTSIEERACTLAKYIIETKDTVRGAARKFGISKYRWNR
jgi:putative DeoR family transcriptional regulator (stage III sporulation protein D)